MQASVLFEQLGTGRHYRLQTDRQGLLNADSLAPGRYRVLISQSGFAAQALVVTIPNSGTVIKAVRMELGSTAYSVEVVGATPLSGLDLAASEIPAPVQSATDREIEASGALDLSDFLNRRMNGVFLNELQGNPLQPDLNYRGYTASPLLGTPQGISVYLDGVRFNQPFGDVMSWDLVPRIAIAETTLIPGSNPLFGLNTLGGSVSLRTKDGVGNPGTALQLSGGSFGRKIAEFEHGGSAKNGLNWYTATNLFFEDGWRDGSPSNVRQFLGKLGWQRERTVTSLSLSYINNSLVGNGLQEMRLLERDYRSTYTSPDHTANRSPFLNWSLRRSLSPNVTVSGLAYFRYIRTLTLNGDTNEDSLDQSLYQPGAAERAALAAAGYTGVPTAGENASNTPFPKWRCIGNALLRDEPAEKCNGLLNRGGIHQRNYGAAGQVGWFKQWDQYRSQLIVGAAFDGNRVGFSQSSELGYLNPDRTVTGVAAFGDGITGGDEDGVPYDTRVELSSRIHSGSFFVTDTLGVGSRLNLTLSGRFNRTTIDNRDTLNPVAGTGSLTGRHVFQRFNPAAGLTYQLASPVSAYFNYSEGSRAPTAIELGCADPESPCKLPNAMAGDPPLRQVRTRTFEGGVRGSGESKVRWSAGWFHADNRDDILFVASEQTGFGYFRNFARTRRQGLELDGSTRIGRVQLGAGYTFLDATFRSAEVLNGAGNSTNEEALEGHPGMESSIEIESGDQIPLIPRHLIKVYSDLQVTRKLLIDVSVIGVAGSYARGNENNRHAADGRYYLGPGRSSGYGVVNLGGRYQVHPRLEIFAQVNNLFDRRYHTAALLGPAAFNASGDFVARALPAIDGEFPVPQSTFFAPGAPRGAWGGLRVRF